MYYVSLSDEAKTFIENACFGAIGVQNLFYFREGAIGVQNLFSRRCDWSAKFILHSES